MKKESIIHHGAVILSFVLAFGATACEVEQPDNSDGLDYVPTIAIEENEVTENSISITLSADNADTAAWYCTEAGEEGGEEELTGEDIFYKGKSLQLKEGKASLTITDLKPQQLYRIFAASFSGEAYSEPAVAEIETAPREKMLSFVSSTKKGFTYRVDVPENETYQHGYVEGWYFDYQLALAKEDQGSEFDMKAFVWNMLVDRGMEASGPQSFEWNAGDYNEKLDKKAFIVGGHHYYALFSFFGAENDWRGTPEVLRIDLDPAGESAESIDISADLISQEKVIIRMECNSDNVNFFFYDLYTKESYDKMMSEQGKEGLANHLFEYGYPVGNTYTDSWGVDPGESYMLAVLGVDYNGDIFYIDKQFDTPLYEKSIYVEMKPYERELQGHHAYDTFELVVAPQHFGELNSESIVWTLQTKSHVDTYLESMGLTLDQLPFEYFYQLFTPMPLPEDQLEMIDKYGYISTLLKTDATYSDLQPDTEYCYIIAIPTGEDENPYKLAYATAKTEAEYGGGEPEEGYAAYLGEWTLTGQTTEDYSTYKEYHLRIEALTPNRSFKLYGWGNSEITQKRPFEVRYNPETQEITIEGEQFLGTETTAAGNLDIILTGLLPARGELVLLDGYSGPMFTGKVDGSRLRLFPAVVNVGGYDYSFQTLTYLGYNNGKFFGFPGDEYNLVNFFIDRASSSSAKRAGLPSETNLRNLHEVGVLDSGRLSHRRH